MTRKQLVITFILMSVAATTTAVFYATQAGEIEAQKIHRKFKKGDYETAIRTYEKSPNQSPARKEVLKELGYSYQWSGQHDKAIEIFRKVLEKEPGDREIKAALAQTLSWEKRYDEAIALGRELAQSGKDPKSNMELAQIYIWSGRCADAQTLLEARLK